MKEKLRLFSEHPWLSMILVLAIAGFFIFFKLGITPLYEWDESLHGEIALEMLRTGDPLNYYYGGRPEAWFAKPPLAIWAMVCSFKIFGTSVWALRLPSALAMLATFFYLFKLIRLYKSNSFAFFTILMLISINGLISIHVGRSGDTDALVILFLIASSYHFLKFIDFNYNNSAIWAGFFLALSFLTKGAAFAVFLPGWLLYAIWRKELKSSITKWQCWLGIGITVLAIVGWIAAIQYSGTEFPERPFGGKNTAETAFKYDLIDRFTKTNSEEWVSSLSFFFTTMDSRFAVWVYWLYLLLLVAILQKRIKRIFKSNNKRSVHLFALFCWVPLSIFLTVVTNKHYWYLAPAFPFIAINGWALIRFYSDKYKLAAVLTTGLFVTTLIIKFNHFNNPSSYADILIENKEHFQNAPRIVSLSHHPLDYFLFLHLQNPNTVLKDDLWQYDPAPGDILMVDQSRTEELSELKTPHLVLGENELKTIVVFK